MTNTNERPSSQPAALRRSKWTAEMDEEMTRRRAGGQPFAKIATAMKLPKAAAIGRAQRLGLDPTDWSSPERFYVMKPTKHSPRKPPPEDAPRKQGRPRTTFAQKRAHGAQGLANAVQRTEPPPPPPFRSPVQDEWPLSMCAELPLRSDGLYESVN